MADKTGIRHENCQDQQIGYSIPLARNTEETEYTIGLCKIDRQRLKSTIKTLPARNKIERSKAKTAHLKNRQLKCTYRNMICYEVKTQ